MQPKPLLLILLIVLSTMPGEIFGQSKTPLVDLIPKIEKHFKVRIFYKYEWIKDIAVDSDFRRQSLTDFLTNTLSERSLTFHIEDNNMVIFMPKSDALGEVKNELPRDETSFVPDGKTYTISGQIKEANSGESIIGAVFFIEELKIGVSSNSFGFFSVSIPSGIYHIKVSAVGQSSTEQKIFLDKDQTLSIELFEQLTQLKDVVVRADAYDRNVSSVEMSVVKMDIKTLKSIPAFLGEADIIKSILLLPGVSTVGEGASGFNVRGGNVDQNLILFDDAPVFNSSHLFGFFSTFNSDVIKDVTLYKGGIPAQYGGRISSVLDVKSKAGNYRKFEGGGGLGIIASRLFLEGPIIKEKTSFIVSARYAYPDWILKKTRNLSLRKSSGYFYDLNAHVNHKINDNHSLQLSAYSSSDGFRLASDTLYQWTTNNASLKWNALLTDKLFINVSGIIGNYTYSIDGESNPNQFRSDFGIKTLGSKVDLTYYATQQHKFDAGLGFNSYHFDSGNLQPIDDSPVNPVDLEEEKAIEYHAFVSDEFKLNSKITIQGGLRFSQYEIRGPNNVFVYQPGEPQSPTSIIDTLTFSKNEKIKTYNGLEPRLSVKFSVTENSSIKVSYNKTIQYLHLVSNTTAVSPLDLWKSSNYYIKPEIGHQIALGYFRNLFNNTIETSVETYYKEVENMLEYKDGAELVFNPFLESALLPAVGKAYGIELMVKRNAGKLTGWVSYTYARSLRQVKGKSEPETINNGEYYPSNFDKPHDLTVVTNYKFTRRLSLSANFTYSTGRPITYPSDVYIVNGYTAVQFDKRNQGRIDDYHRLDLSFTIDENLNINKKWKGSWVFSIYNVYGRKNPYSVFFKPEYSGKLPQSFQLSVLGTIFPSITYNFKF
jgi:hypothetical protein